MLNRKRIEIAISDAEREFNDCWRKLMSIATPEGDGAEMLSAIISFQPALGMALYKLETLYVAVCREARDLVHRRPQLNPKWLHGRIHTLNGYKHLLQKAADIGKALGDSYAWIFYQNDRELLRKHDEQQPNPHPPTGIGGRGEIEFVRRFPKFGGYVVVAHSTTTFLRLGDISLVDPLQFKVAGIGELKTRGDGETNLALTVNLVGPELQKEMLPESQSSDRPSSAMPRESLPPQILERLKRQIKRMHECFRPVDKSRMLPPMQVSTTFNCSKLADLYHRSSTKTWGHIKADRGLLLVGIRLPGDSLFKRLTLRSVRSKALNLSRTGEAAREVVDKSLPDNSIRLRWLSYPARTRYELLLGMRPLFWWPLDEEVIEALLFKRFVSMTLYNPAFLIRDIRRSGLQVEVGKGGAIRVWKEAEGKRFEVKGMPYFLDMIQTHMFPDCAIACTIQRFVEAVEKADFKHSACVNMNLDIDFE